MTKGWTLYDPRLAWMLVAPVVLLLIFFLVLPIVVMAVYTFFTFVTAGVETSDADTGELAGIPLRQLLSRLPVEDAAGRRHDGVALRAPRLFPRLFHLGHDASGTNGCCCCLLIVPFWISFTIRTFSWIHILGEQGVINVALMQAGPDPRADADALHRRRGHHGAAAFPAALHDPQRLCQPGEHRPHADRGSPLDGLHQRAGLSRSDAAAVAARPRRPACCSASCWPPAAM